MEAVLGRSSLDSVIFPTVLALRSGYSEEQRNARGAERGGPAAFAAAGQGGRLARAVRLDPGPEAVALPAGGSQQHDTGGLHE